MSNIPLHTFKCKCHLNNNSCDATPKSWKKGELSVTIQMLDIKGEINYQFRVKSTETTTIANIKSVIAGTEGKITVEYHSQCNKSYLFLSGLCIEDAEKIKDIFGLNCKRKALPAANNPKRVKTSCVLNKLPNYIWLSVFSFLPPSCVFNKKTDKLICSLVKKLKLSSTNMSTNEMSLCMKRHTSIHYLQYAGTYTFKGTLRQLTTLNISKAKISSDDINKLLHCNKHLKHLEISNVDESIENDITKLPLSKLCITESVDLEVVKHIHTITELSIPYISQKVTALKKLPQLRSLEFAENIHNVDAIQCVIDLHLTHITMHTSSNYKSVISDDEAAMLKKLQKGVLFLDLSWMCNQNSIESICFSDASMTLKFLRFHSLLIKNSCISQILETCEVLEELDISYCGGLSEFCIEGCDTLPPLKRLTHSIEKFSRDTSVLMGLFPSIELTYKSIKAGQFA